MKCQHLVVIILRLLAMYWMTIFVFGLLTMVGSFVAQSVPDVYYTAQLVLHPIFYGTLSFLLWIFAEPISHRVVGHSNPELNFKEITAEHLYTLGILGFGIYLAASHLPDLINYVHYTATYKTGDQWMRDANGHSMYDLTRELTACMAGVALVMLAPVIARKVAAKGKQLHQQKIAE